MPRDNIPLRPKTYAASVCNSDAGSDLNSLDDVMVIGIDFGTTYSGVAWATAVDFQNDQINLITTWPGCGTEEGKVPSEIFYENDEITWGYTVPDDACPLRWFKLTLLKDEDLSPKLRQSEFILRARKMQTENDKTAIDTIADYLRALWEHVLHTITKARGDAVIDTLRFHVVITLPAIWKGYARQAMQESAKRAGILDDRSAGATTLGFAPEPEAAALSTLSEPGLRMEQGEVYLVCDGGGGTVDLTCYEIESTGPIAMREVAEGTGGMCGGIFVDEAFERICKARLGRKWDSLSKLGINDVIKKQWQKDIKPQFEIKNSAKEYIVSIPAEAFKNEKDRNDTSREPLIKNGRIHFKEKDLESAFTKVFDETKKLIGGLFKTVKNKGLSASGIILVGGLGSSPFLFAFLKQTYPKVIVLQSGGMRPLTAICRGAVFKGFADLQKNQGAASESVVPIKSSIVITSTISRASFGTCFRTPFDAKKHIEEDKKWDNDECQSMAINQMHWYLKRGDDVSRNDPVRSSFYLNFRKPYKILTTGIWQCYEQTAPNRKTSSVTQLCSLKWTPDVPFSGLSERKNIEGEKYRVLEYEIEFTPLGATAEFAIYINGRRQGTADSSIEIQYET